LFGQYIDLNPRTIFVVLVFSLILMMILTLNIINSPTGRAMLAMRNSESAAQAMGVSIIKYRLLAFMIATVFAVFGGILYMVYFNNSQPDTWSLAFSLNILAAVIVGGSRSIFGVVLGSFMLFGLDVMVFQRINLSPSNPNVQAIINRATDPETIQSLTNLFNRLNNAVPTMSYVINGILIIIVIMFYPGGLIQMIQTIKFKLIKLGKFVIRKIKVYRYGEDV